MTAEILPELAVVPSGTPVRIELRGLDAGTLTVRHLGHPVATHEVQGPGLVSLGMLPPGGYGVEFNRDGQSWRTAVDVQRSPWERLRYGFVASYPPGRDPAAVADQARRLHLTGIQFYDWAYRHAGLLGGGEQYADPLGQPISLATVADLARAVQRVGASALGYAAVYAVGNDEWPQWSHDALLQPDGTPYSLADFLRLVDPAAPDWLAHFAADLAAATEQLGFDGFHLDQYGYPKWATRPDGRLVDVAVSFDTLIRAVRERLPRARLVFNQVNDFPTVRLAEAPQDAVYIEPWEPQTTLGALAATVTRARTVASGRPVVLAAYQHVYASVPDEVGDRSTALTMATLFSHGATQLLAGEANRILVDPYYVRNHQAGPSTQALLKRWYDFLVEHDELLMRPAADVTAAFAGDYNDDCDVAYPDTEVAGEAVAGAVWRRIVELPDRLVVHLVNLTGQPDTHWDAPREPFPVVSGGRLRVRRVGGSLPRITVADPDAAGHLQPVTVAPDGNHALATLPPLNVWQIVSIELREDTP
jgi:dextranase